MHPTPRARVRARRYIEFTFYKGIVLFLVDLILVMAGRMKWFHVGWFVAIAVFLCISLITILLAARRGYTRYQVGFANQVAVSGTDFLSLAKQTEVCILHNHPTCTTIDSYRPHFAHTAHCLLQIHDNAAVAAKDNKLSSAWGSARLSH